MLEAKKEMRDQRIAELKQNADGFEARLKAIDNFIEKYAAFNSVKSSIDDASDLKRLLKGSGVLEFHILADDIPESLHETMVKRLDEGDPKPRAGDTVQWFPVDRPEELGHPGVMHADPNGKVWALAFITPEKSMTNRDPNKPRWALERSRPDFSQGERKVDFQFDTVGARYFSQLTGDNVGKPLAIMLDERLISAPTSTSRSAAAA